MYDPTQDPRYVPLEDEMPAQERELAEHGAAEAEEKIRQLDQILVMFQHAGWQELAIGFDRLAEELDTQLQKVHDQSTWQFYRGQLANVEWLQQLPAEIAKKQRDLRRDHAALLRLLGKE